MNVGELKKLLEDASDDEEFYVDVSMETKGFTIVDLVFGIVITAIVAAVMVPALSATWTGQNAPLASSGAGSGSTDVELCRHHDDAKKAATSS